MLLNDSSLLPFGSMDWTKIGKLIEPALKDDCGLRLVDEFELHCPLFSHQLFQVYISSFNINT